MTPCQEKPEISGNPVSADKASRSSEIEKRNTKFIIAAVFLAVFVMTVLPVVSFAVARLRANEIVQILSLYQKEHGIYPKSLSTLAGSFEPKNLRYETDEAGKSYLLTTSSPPFPFDYQYASYTKRWYGGVRGWIEARIANYLETEFNKAQKRMESKKALAIARTALLFGNLTHNFQEVRVGDAYQLIGLAYMGMNRPIEVERHFQMAEELYKKSTFINPERMINFYCNLGFFYLERARHEEAKNSYLKVQNILDTHPPIKHSRISEAIIGLANSHLQLGDIELAREIYQKISVSKNSDDNWRAAAWAGLAGIYLMEQDFEQAEAYYKRALSLWKKSAPDQERNIAQSKINLAAVYTKTERHDEARDLVAEAVEILKKYSDFNNLKLLEAKNLLAVITFNAGHYDEGAALFKELVTDYEKNLGSHSPYLTSPLMNLAVYSYQRKDYAIAANYYERAISVWEKGGNDIETDVLLRSSLAETYSQLKKFQEALRAYEKLLPILIRRDGEKSEAVNFTFKKIKELSAMQK